MAALAVAMWSGHSSACLPGRVAELELSRHWAQRVLGMLASAYAMAGRFLLLMAWFWGSEWVVRLVSI